MGISILHIISQNTQNPLKARSSTPSKIRESHSPKTLELAMHPQETNWNEPHAHKQRY